MRRTDPRARLQALRKDIQSLGERFAHEAPPLLSRALDRAMERLIGARAEWFNDLRPEAVTALRRSVRAAIQRGSDDVHRRLLDHDVWLNPTIELARGPGDNLDQPNHRAWVAILNGADALDPVLNEFGLPPSPVPDPGGGHFGLQPQRLSELDPGGSLARLWRRYLGLHAQYREALRRIPEEERARDRDEALRRWREPE